uniref:Alpha-2-macroglobulin-like protein 1 n=1 Tax=Myripristis murdjan TaxID=586833 RepID=A0A667YGG1_9TELE
MHLLPTCSIFAVMVSSQVTGGSQESLCAQIHSPTEPVSLIITLMMEDKSNTTLLEEAVKQDFYRCINFQVPMVSSSTVATIVVVVQGENDSMTKKTKILIIPPAFINIIQTDKPIYKPGQTVQFRIVSLDTRFVPVDRDPNTNRIAQWLDQPVVSGILDLSHPMSPEAAQGSYMITAWLQSGEQISHSFDIKEYVLPKFEVKVHLPSIITILDQEAPLKICGKYTYGKPVLGSVKAVVCRKNVRFYWYSSATDHDICKKYELITDKTGCATQTLNVTEFSPTKRSYEDSFEVEAEMEEYGTGVILKGSGQVSFTSQIRTVTFKDVSAAYKPGIAFEGKVTTVFNNQLRLQPVAHSRKKEEEEYVPKLRRAEYRLAHHFVTPFYSKSKSFLKLLQSLRKFSCDKDATVRAQYIIQGDELKKGQEVLDFFYLVMSRGGIVQHGRVPVAVQAGIGELSVSLQRMTDLAPVAQVVVYTVMPSGEGVADSQDFPVQLCFNNKVSLKFSSEQELPGEKTKLSVQAQPGSLCSVRAIDQSVLLLQPEQELTVGYVYNQLPVQKLSGYSYQVEDFEPYPCILPMPEPELEVEVDPATRRKRTVYFGPNVEKNDVYSIFKVRPCSAWMIALAYDDVMYGTVRQVFYLFHTGLYLFHRDSGSVNVEKTVPDSITKWAAGAFCTSSAGFGVAPNTALTAFQPFFVSLTLPYSVIRGEVFTLKATVFNYLTKCIMVGVTLADSEQYTFRECDDCQYTVCLCGEESRTFMWIVTPTALGEVSLKVSAEALKTEQLCGNEVAAVPEKGQIDTVVRTLLVEVNGPVEKDVSLLLPEMFVAGSAKASVSVLGDLMGRAMQNLDRLLAMPYGCGEQNMVLFAPNIFILNYLKSTGQLTKEIQDRATRFLESGYQRELTYKHDDGSYSAFGKSDESGNTWLTSFVMKSFGGAKPYIFVDPKHIADARKWLASHQRQDGCINSVGKLFHNGMKGGVSDDVSLTAYITAAMLELDANVTEPVVEKCLGCLKAAVAGQLDNLYTTALLSYTFTLAGDEETRSKLLTYLHQKANTEGGTRHWERAGASAKRLDSLEVEMTSYVLLALLSGPAMPEFSLDYSSAIVRWLAQQQNAYGGFSSTQDTVVALQALAKYGAATYSPEGASTVTVTSLGGQKKEFTVDQDNRLLYQEEKLTEVPGEYKIRAEGRSCVLAQISMRYNIPPPPDFSAFHIAASTMAKCNISRPQLIVFVEVRYCEQSRCLSLHNQRLNVFCLQLCKDETKSYSVTLEEDIPVRNLKPAVVKVYDYYQTSKIQYLSSVLFYQLLPPVKTCSYNCHHLN